MMGRGSCALLTKGTINDERRIKMKAILISVILALLVVAAWAPAQVQKPTKEPILIGHVTPLSGMIAATGLGSSRGAKLAVDIINEKGGINGRPLRLVTRDDQNKPDIAIAMAREMRSRLGINLIMGCGSTLTGLAVAPLAPQLGFVFIASQTSAERLRGLNANTFHTVTDPRTNWSGMGRIISKNFPDVKRWACVNPDYDYGHYTWENFVYELQHRNPETDIVASRWAPFGAGGGYGPHIQAILDSKAEALYMGFWAGDLVAFAKEAKEYDLFSKLKVIVCPYFDWETVISLGASVPEVWMGEIYYHGVYNYPESEEFYRRFAQEYGEAYAFGRQGSAAMGYAAIEAYAAALKVTRGSDKPEGIIKALQDLKYKSIFGPTWMRSKENGVYAGYALCHVVPDKTAQYGFKVVQAFDLRGTDNLLPVEEALNWPNTRNEWFKTHKR